MHTCKQLASMSHKNVSNLQKSSESISISNFQPLRKVAIPQAWVARCTGCWDWEGVETQVALSDEVSLRHLESEATTVTHQWHTSDTTVTACRVSNGNHFTRVEKLLFLHINSLLPVALHRPNWSSNSTYRNKSNLEQKSLRKLPGDVWSNANIVVWDFGTTWTELCSHKMNPIREVLLNFE